MKNAKSLNISELHINIINSFSKLQTELAALEPLLCEHDKMYPAWFQAPEMLAECSKLPLRKQIFHFISQIEYLDEQQPRATLLGPGVVASSAATMIQLAKVNQAKKEFKQTMIGLRSVWKDYDANALKRDFALMLSDPDIIRPAGVGASLEKLGLARLHLKQCYRLIPMLPADPISVSYTWANTRAIKKTTVAGAEEMLRVRKSTTVIMQQLQKIKNLDPKMPLAIVQDLAPHLRVNILFADDKADRTRIMLKGPVPIFFPVSDNATQIFPEINCPPPRRERDPGRTRRNDVKIEEEIFLPSLRAHRYLEYA